PDEPAPRRAPGPLGQGPDRDRHAQAGALDPDQRAHGAREQAAVHREPAGGHRDCAQKEGSRGGLRGGQGDRDVSAGQGRDRRRRVLRGARRPEGGRDDRRRALPSDPRLEGRRPRARAEAGRGYGEKDREEDRMTALQDRKSTRLNSSHVSISYAVFCLKKKKPTNISKRG